MWLQFSGAVGTLASLGDRGREVAEALALELELACPPVAWHAARDGVASVAADIALLCGVLGKPAQDIILLAQSEVGELAEPAAPGRGGSSTMPQKRNPVLCEHVVAAARNVHALSGVMFGAMLADHERATGPWHSEWVALPQMFALTSGALRHTVHVIAGLEVDAEAMRRNLDVTGGLIMAEAIMMKLAAFVGRDAAHDIVEEVCAQVHSSGKTLRELLCSDTRISSHLDAAAIDALLDPAGYTGDAEMAVDRVLASVRQGG